VRGGAALAVLLVAWPAAPPAKADYYRLLDEDRDAAQVRVDLIRGARASIDATYFIVGKDSVALAFLAELRAASLRGVTVRLLIDAPFNKLPLDVRAALRRDGVDIQEYHPFRLTKPWWLGRRLHDKLLIVDDAHLVTGGRNLQASYFGRGTAEPDGGGRNYIDRDAYVRGPAAAAAAAYFDRVWDSREVRRVKLGRFRPKVMEEDCEGRTRCVERQARLAAQIDEAVRELARERDTLEDAGLVDPLEPLVFDARDVGPVEFLHDPVGFRDREDGIGTRLFDLMDETRSSLILESPWLVPSRALRRSLREAVERGVHVRGLTNS
jgi:putative cardiolipin synthase